MMAPIRAVKGRGKAMAAARAPPLKTCARITAASRFPAEQLEARCREEPPITGGGFPLTAAAPQDGCWVAKVVFVG